MRQNSCRMNCANVFVYEIIKEGGFYYNLMGKIDKLLASLCDGKPCSIVLCDKINRIIEKITHSF